MNIYGGGGGHHNIGLYLGAISMHFRVFFKVNVQNGEYFFSCQNLEFFYFFFWEGGGGVLEILDFFFFGGGVKGRCWARTYIWRKNESNPSPLGLSHDNH